MVRGHHVLMHLAASRAPDFDCPCLAALSAALCQLVVGVVVGITCSTGVVMSWYVNGF